MQQADLFGRSECEPLVVAVRGFSHRPPRLRDHFSVMGAADSFMSAGINFGLA
jgi:hypothetical protein